MENDGDFFKKRRKSAQGLQVELAGDLDLLGSPEVDGGDGGRRMVGRGGPAAVLFLSLLDAWREKKEYCKK